MCKPYIYAVNTTTGSNIANGGVYPLTQVAKRCGQAATLSNGGIALNSAGCYEVDATVSVEAGAAGEITATLYQDGVAVIGATGSVAAAAQTDNVTIPITAVVRASEQCRCCDTPTQLTVVVSGQATTSLNAAIRVVRV